MTRTTARSRALTRTMGVAAALSALCAGLFVATPASAAATLALTIDQTTGTAPFSADDAAGNDSGPDNDIIRTNDTISYNLGIRFEGDDQTTPTVRFTVPRGQELVSLPPFCLPGSGATPQTLPALTPPITGTSWQSYPTQDVVCVLDDQTGGTSLNYPFVTRVKPEVTNGTTMDPVVFEVSSDQIPDAVATEPLSQTVSAAPRFDLSKRLQETSVDQGPLFQGTTACVHDATLACRQLTYPVTISVPGGGKGVAPLGSSIVFEDNLDPESFYGATVWAQMVAKAGSEAAATAAYAPIFRNCTPITASSGFRTSTPYSALSLGAYANTTNSVRNSGSVSCTSGQPGENGVITITGADTTGSTVPTTTGSGNAITGGVGYIVTLELRIHVPQAALVEFGTGPANSFSLSTHNEYVNVQMTGIDGTPAVDDPTNNARDAVITAQVSGNFDKAFTGVFGQAGNTPTQAFAPGGAFEGPPGSGVRKDGNTVVMPGQSVQSVLSLNESAPAGSGTAFTRTLVGCDVWDADRLALAGNPSWTGFNPAFYPSNGSPVYLAQYLQANAALPASTLGTPASGARNVTVEYSIGAAGAGAAANCATGTWVTDPSDLVTPTVDAQGRTVWPGVNRVRVTFNTEWPVGTSFGDVNLSFAIGQVVLDSDSTEPIGNWASRIISQGVKTSAQATTDPARVTALPTYNKTTHSGNFGDRLIQGEGIVRVQKYVENLTTGQFVDDTVPQYTSGSNIRYRLNPSLTTAVAVEGNPALVVIEDCLPEYQVYGSTVQGANAITPEVVQMGAPADAEIACAANRQYVRYNLGELPIGAPIEPLIVTAEIISTARNGVYTNQVLASSPIDGSPANLRDDDVQIQLVVPTGIKVAKTVNKPVIEVNPEGVETPRTVQWSVFFANVDSPQNVSNVDVIDVLPADGVNNSDFEGQLVLDSATAVAGDGIRILYTATPSAALVVAPGDASNGASGSTVWCDAVSGAVVSGNGTAADCPTANGEVTGLRFQRPGAFTPATPFQVDIAMTPVGNSGGDVYNNVTAGRADGVTQGVGPAIRRVEIISSSVGDRMWEDVNGDGLQSEGEPGIAGFPVRLVGTDLDGNPVSLETVTDENGAYAFENLASGEYQVIFDPNGLNSNTTFTTQHAGDDTTIDSDADVTTGATQTFTLAPDSADPTLDAGLIIDRDFDMVLDKRYIGATDLTDDNTSTVTYELDVINNGTAEGTYDLVDALDFGGDVEIGDVVVENVTPGEVDTNPDYDGVEDTTIASGVTLPGESTHTYRVTIDVTVATTISVVEAECTTTTTETGGGFLNEAELTVDGVTVTDKACGDIDVPPTDGGTTPPGGATPPTGGLAITGGTMVGIGVSIAALAALALGLVLTLRRRRMDETV
ncbi:SdrD B-like domain-containing protein [Microbacterium sp. NPDC090225]|uniref:SdrD B-like domain-containing protein n=1 Tax=Microbacterium sp. NPDC090225 TaxID=3364207 RepID=UPI003805B0ED